MDRCVQFQALVSIRTARDPAFLFLEYLANERRLRKDEPGPDSMHTSPVCDASMFKAHALTQFSKRPVHVCCCNLARIDWPQVAV